MAEHEKDKKSLEQGQVEQGRRNFLKGSGAVAGGLAAANPVLNLALASTKAFLTDLQQISCG